jgi:hypothetical protein
MSDFGNLSYHIFKDLEIPFDEKGTTCGNVRLVQWVKDGEEPDINKAKLEIRKSYTSSSGEKIGKGYTFSTPEGPSELVEGLVSVGYGNTKNLLRELRLREDFLNAANTINEDDDYSDDDGEMFDMRDLLLSDDGEEEEDETA